MKSARFGASSNRTVRESLDSYGSGGSKII